MFWLLVLLGLVHLSTGESLLDECATSAKECVCRGQDIICSGKSLSSIPKFHPTYVAYSNIYLDGNRITTIHDYDFDGLVTADELYIDLSGNSISDFRTGAFSSIQNSSLRLKLDSNRYASIPSALRELNIVELSMDQLTSLDTTTIFSLSASLVTLSLGIRSISEWPEAMHTLRKLESLTVRDLPLTDLPFDAFHGFEHSLRTLDLQRSNLPRVPDAVCPLRNLRELSFSRRTNSHIHSPTPYCQTPLTSVTTLKLHSVGLSEFPDSLKTFPSVTHLEITGHPNLRYVKENAIPSKSLVTTLSLARNGLRQIPWSLRLMTKLRYLDLSNNEISTIEGNDLSLFAPLVNLSLAGNPLDYISDTVFSSLSSYLHNLSLRNTNLTAIPSAITRLTHVEEIDLRDNKIDCSCDLLFLSKWTRLSVVKLLGNCLLSSETIETFVRRDLKQCS